MKIRMGLAAMAAAVLAGAAGANAAEGDMLIRARVLGVMPDESGTISVIGGKADAENTVVPELDFTYFLSDRIAMEIIAAVTPHDVEATGTTLGTVDLGDVWLLPPTLTLQYHAMPEGVFDPYVGAGINYTHFFSSDAPGGTVTQISYGDSFGPALQAGADVRLNDNWVFNVDLKKVWINTDVKVNGGAITADVDLDPWIIGLGLGYRF